MRKQGLKVFPISMPETSRFARCLGHFLLAATLVVGPGVLTAQGEERAYAPPAQGAILHVTEENDAPLLTDRHYTQGFRLAYLGADDRLPDWLLNVSTDVPAPGFEVHARRLGFELGQDLYTPENLAAAELLPHDRPYAGWLYTGMVFQRRGATRRRDIPVLENLRLNLGIVGPESLAEALQERFHRAVGEHWPQGWRHQLHTEPGFALRYQRAWQFAWRRNSSAVADCIPHVGMSLGNVDTSFRVGAMGRVGWHLPEDFGVQTIHSLAVPDGGRRLADSPWRMGFYFFAGAEGSAVLYTTFLDGNLFRESHHVERKPFVGELKGGMALVANRVEIAATVVYRTEEFVGQHQGDRYTSLLLKYKF